MAIVRALLALLLLGAACRVHAIGDSGGCAMDRALMETAESGTGEAMAAHLARHLTRAWQAVEPAQRSLLETQPRAVKDWQASARQAFFNGTGLGCGEGPLLDRAIRGGNLALVQWLLDEGADPNGAGRADAPSVFWRCPMAHARPGLSEAQANERTVAAYRLLMSRGADKNRARASDSPFSVKNALSECREPKMLKRLLEWGVDRSPQAGAQAVLNAPLQQAVWDLFPGGGRPEKVQLLAQAGGQDVRGTRIEAQLAERCRAPAAAPICQWLAPLLQVSPGIWPQAEPWGAVLPPPEAFALQRETCSFPEIQFTRDLELAVVSHAGGQPTGLAFAGPAHEGAAEALGVEVIVHSPQRPVLLVFQAKRPRIWSVRYTEGTRVLGAVLQREYGPVVPGAVLGLPAGASVSNVRCAVNLEGEGATMTVRHGFSDPLPRSLDPFHRHLPFKAYGVDKGAVTVGQPLASGEWAKLTPMPALAASRHGLAPHRAALSVLEGRAALDAQVAQGRLERAGVEAFLVWMGAVRGRTWPRNGLPKNAPNYAEAYVNKAPELKLPAGLRGAQAATFFTPADTRLVGELGDSTVYFGAQSGRNADPNGPRVGTCLGPRC